MDNEKIREHISEENPWDEFMVDADLNFAPEPDEVGGDEERAPEDTSEIVPQVEESEPLTEMPSFDEHMEEMRENSEVEDQMRQEEIEADEKKKQRFVEQLEKAKEKLEKAERDLRGTKESFDRLINELDLAIEDKDISADVLEIQLGRAREALDDYKKVRERLDTVIDEVLFYNEKAAEALSDDEFVTNREKVMEDSKKVDAARAWIGRADDKLERMGKKIRERR